ncbi:MAG: AAA-like domain-containing protein [Rhizonema sp. PD37]|nr:AAA-like domain-containing protein [Rhizonema sp. PD37]
MTKNHEYKVGGSLGEKAPSYVVRQTDSELYRWLKAGEFCYLFNSRQMGKTSLLVRVMKRLEAEGFACVTIDVSGQGSQEVNLEQWYSGIVYSLVTELNIIDVGELFAWWDERIRISPVQRLGKFIEEIMLPNINKKIIIFIDEIDSILSLDFLTDDFFALIRSCYEKRNFNPDFHRLTFALVGVATPSDLIQDERRTPFNIGKAIQLAGFKLEETQPLLPGLATKTSNPMAVMSAVLNWTGGQPFLTQKVCKLIFHTDLPIPEGEIAQWVEKLVQGKIISNWEAQDEQEHLKTIRDRILRGGGEDTSLLLGLYQQVLLADASNSSLTYDNSPKQMKLRLTGLVVEQQEKLRVYNQIYSSIFNLNWVEKQLANLRPYAESFKAWKDSHFQDESRLLRGQALRDALIWANDKSLSTEDNQFLNASRELEQRETKKALAVKEEESRILSEANETLTTAQKKANLKIKKANQRIRFGSAILAVCLVAAIVASVFAGNAQQELYTAQKAAQLEQNGIVLSRDPFAKGEIEGLLEAIGTGQDLKSLVKDKQSLADYPAYSPMFNLQSILLNIRERNQLEYHSFVNSVAFSPDGKTLDSASRDGTIKLWNVATGKEISTLSGHKDSVNSVAFSPDGKTFASASADKTVKLWNVATGKEISTWSGHKSSVYSVAFGPDSKTLASASADKTIKLWNVATGKEISTLSGHQSYVSSVTFSPDGKTLASASGEGTIKLWNVATGKEISTLSGHKDSVNSVAFSLDGNTLASASDDKTIKLWNVATGKEISTWSGHKSLVNSVAFSPNGNTLASASWDKTIKLWNVATGKEISTLSGHHSSVNSVAFSLDGNTLASASDDKTIKLWNVATGKEISTWSGHKSLVNSVAFSPNGNTLASASWDKTIKLWNVATGKEISTLSGHHSSVNSVAFSLDGNTLASASDDKTIKLWNVATGKEISTWSRHHSSVNSVAFSPDGKTLASASADSIIKLWNVATGKEISTLSGHKNSVISVAFSPDGKTLASASTDKTVKLWNVATGKEISTLSGHKSSVYSVVFSPDGKTLASASWDNTIKLWNVATSKEIFTLSGHENTVYSVVFSPDGKTLASASWDKTIKLWSLDLDDLLARGCNYLKEYLATRDELRKKLCPGK